MSAWNCQQQGHVFRAAVVKRGEWAGTRLLDACTKCGVKRTGENCLLYDSEVNADRERRGLPPLTSEQWAARDAL